MENQFDRNGFVGQQQVYEGAVPKTFVSNVAVIMSLGLLISGILAYLFGTSEGLMSLLINFETGSHTILGWIVMLAPLGLVILMGARIQKMSSSALISTFVIFSAIMGISLSYIFLIYTAGSIATTFFITSGMFGVMAIAGYTTKTDLTKMGSILMLGLVGIIIASVVNWFLHSSSLYYIISFAGVAIFTGLTAYDMQRIKQMGMMVEANSEDGKKMAVMGALSLYLNFVNLFLMLLRFFGNRD